MPVEVIAIICSVVPSVIGWLISPAIKNLDNSLSSLTAKIDQLTVQDTKILIELESLRARVTHLEFLVHRGLDDHKR